MRPQAAPCLELVRDRSRGFSHLTRSIAAGVLLLTSQVVNAQVAARVGSRVEDSERVVLGGHVPPAIRQATATGRLAPSQAMNHLIMVLRPSAEQDHALQTLLDRQLDKASPNFHRWIQPEEFGARFGVADADIAKVTDWLRASGLTVESVAKGKRFIQFSGSVAQVEKAFRTEMHSYTVNGKARISNNSDISIPAALQPVIAGVPTLNNFFKTSDFHSGPTLAERNVVAQPGTLAGDGAAGTPNGKAYFAAHGQFKQPEYTNGTTHFVGAGDFATIYNTTPLLAGGFDGTGVSVGVIGRTELHIEDIQMYRQFFSLKVNDPTFIIAGEAPGIVGGDDGESYLDVEVSGGAAPGAAIKFITSRATLTTDGVDLAAMYAVQNNLTDIISESYGQCENNFSASAISFYANLWGQAAAQGQTVFVSSGDSGPAGCDSPNNTFANFGYAVSGLASTAYNVAVGGTLFADTTGGPWWGTTATASPPFSSALGYIPEIPWNEARGSGATGASNLWSGSGGISAYFTTPAWQHGFGVPVADPPYAGTGAFSSPAAPFVPGPHRYMPDVSMAAAAQHDGTLYCAEGICQLSSTNTIVNAAIVGGTSVAAPTMAGVQALINQVNGGRQGMANYVYYALADAQHTGGLDCASNHAGTTLDANCAFRDVQTGNTLVCANSACTAANKIGWTATAGYDLATGLGSPNAAKLANLWNTVTFSSSTTTLNASQSTGLTHGQPVTLSGTVSGLSGTPTGNVTFIPSSGGLGNPMDPNTGAFLNQVPLAALDGSGNYSVNVTNLPAGTYNVVARYGGDGTFAASTSAPIQFTVSSEGTTVTIAPNAFNGTTCVETPQTTFTYGSYIWTDVTVAGSSGQGAPTGSVTVTDNSVPIFTTALNSNGVGHFLSGAVATSSCVFGYTFQDAPPLTVGTHLLGASYSGDSTFGVGSATPVTVTITPATVPGALATGSSNISSGGTVQLTFTLTGLSGAGPGTLNPTGTVTFTDTTTATVLGTATLNPTPGTTSATAIFGARAVLTTTGITAAGANSITASWPGDTNYAGVTSGAVTVTVQTGTATSVGVTSNANPSTVGGRPTWTATMTPTTVTSGTVGFYDGDFLLGTGTVGAAHTTTFRPAATVNLPAGVHNITAVYQGTATFNSSVSSPFAQTFNQTATTVQLTAKNSGVWGQLFTMSGALGLAGTVTPPATGTVQFLDGAAPLGSPQPITIVTAALGGFGIFQAQMGNTLPAGTHTLTAQLTDPNYTAPVSNSQTVIVSQATPSVSSTGGTFTYDGNPHAGSGSATGGAGEALSITLSYVGIGATTYGPSATAPSGAGTYQVTASTAGDTNNTGGSSAPAALTIGKATPVVSATGGTFTYDGNPHAGSGSATGGASETLSTTLSYVGTGATTYGPSASAPSNAGTYSVTASTSGDANNNGGTSAPAALTIDKANPTVTATGGTFTFDGNPHAGSGSATGGAGESLTVTLSYAGTGATTYGPTATAPTSSGTYQVTAHTDGDANNNSGDSTPAVLTISGNATMSGTKTVAGIFTVDSVVTYTVTLTNGGTSTQGDNPGDEFVDVLPAQLTLLTASADSGAALATVATNTVTWNGSLAPSGVVTITITAKLNVVATGTTVSNQGTIHYDGSGTGSNGSTTTTDDPGVVGSNDPTVFAVTEGYFYTITPCRLVDTRIAAGPYGAPALAANATRSFTAAGQCGIPPDVKAISFNVAVVGPTIAGDLRIYATGTAVPTVSAINYTANGMRANNGLVQLGSAGDFSVQCDQTSGTTDIVIDVNGYMQ